MLCRALWSPWWLSLFLYAAGDVERHPGPRRKQRGERPPLPTTRGRAVGEGTRRDREKHVRVFVSWLLSLGIVGGLAGLLDEGPKVVNDVLDSYGEIPSSRVKSSILL